MKHFRSKRVMLFFSLLVAMLPLSCFPTPTKDATQPVRTISLTYTETESPTETFTATVTSTITASVTSTYTPVWTASSTNTVISEATQTSISVVLPTKTRRKSTKVPATETPTATFCPPPTPEPLWVEPVTSPTDQLSQTITVYIGYGVEVTIVTESGTFSTTGSFSAYSNPASVEITLLPNTVHHLTVSAKVRAEGNGCVYSYNLSTTADRQGNPLTIVQGVPNP